MASERSQHSHKLTHVGIIAILLAFLLPMLAIGLAQAQAESQLRLTLRRDFGTAIGSRIRGTFSLQVAGPEDLAEVVFLIDEQVIDEDSGPPFRRQFRTDDFPPGVHRLSALGYTTAGDELASNTLVREFLSADVSARLTTTLIITLFGLIVGGRLLTSWISNRSRGGTRQPKVSSMLGGAICPNCGRAFALHLWGINLVAGRLERCPHCGKWRLVRRATPEAIRAAEEHFTEQQKSESPGQPQPSDEERWRQQLDDSRFDDAS